MSATAEMDFVVPLAFCDLENVREESSRQLYVTAVLPQEQAEKQLRRVVFELCEQDALCICSQQNFDEVYSLIKAFDMLSPYAKQQLLDCLASNLAMLTASLNTLLSLRDKEDAALEALPQQRTALKVYCYFLTHLASTAASARPSTVDTSAGKGKKGKASAQFDYEQHRDKVMRALSGVLALNLYYLFGLQNPEVSLPKFLVGTGSTL